MRTKEEQLEQLRKNYLRARAIGAKGWMEQIQRDAAKVKAQLSEKTEPDAYEQMKALLDNHS